MTLHTLAIIFALWIGACCTLGTAWAGINHLRSLHHSLRNHGEGDGVGELGVGRLHNDRSQ